MRGENGSLPPRVSRPGSCETSRGGNFQANDFWKEGICVMALKAIVQRISLEGGAAIKAQLEAIGRRR